MYSIFLIRNMKKNYFYLPNFQKNNSKMHMAFLQVLYALLTHLIFTITLLSTNVIVQ